MAHSFIACTACLRRNVVGLRPSSAVASAITATAIPSRQFATTTRTVVDAPKHLDAGAADLSTTEKKSKDRLETVVHKHLKYMSDDPYAVGQYVEKALKRNAFDEALLLVQKSSRGSKQVVVAWNLLIDYQLNQQQTRRALKIFNEMKKRGQLPNVRTFTVLFRGLAKSQHPKQAVSEAVKHYNMLLNDKRLEPNSIHLNAVLNVCAKAGDLDNMFLVANSVNESTRSPTSFTYATIFNALRHNIFGEMKDLPAEQQEINAAEVIDRAKSLWEEVISKWTNARLVIDEELVCSMGRLLLASPRKEDKRQIFDLLEQTMAIPNLIKNPELGSQLDESMRDVAVIGSSKPAPSSRSAAYAVPGRNSLALVLTALATTRQTTAGIKYWNIMVRHYGIVPDSDNWMRMFGMLKVAKSSAHASSILDIMPDEYMDPKPFRIAMETCVRDNLNKNAVSNANRILDTMLQRLENPDLQALRLYLRVALVCHSHLRALADQGQPDEAKRLYGTQITESLARLWEPYKQAHYHYFKAAAPRNEAAERVVYNGKREVIALARHMISAFDKVMNEKMLPERDTQDLRPIAAKINREVQKFFSEREAHEPRLPSVKGGGSAAAADDAASQKRGGGQRRDADEPYDIDDDINTKQGAEWIWDTYRPPRPEWAPRSSQRPSDSESSERPSRTDRSRRANRPNNNNKGHHPRGRSSSDATRDGSYRSNGSRQRTRTSIW